MDLISESSGFWHQWDIQVLNFQVVSLLNLAAVVFLAAMSETFDLTKLIDLANWNIGDLYIFLGPIVAQAASLLLVDSATWLVGYDFGAANEAIIYWAMIAANVLIQVAGNGTSVLVYGVYALIIFGILTAFALLPIVALSNPISLALTVLFFLTVIGPIMVDTFGFFLFGSFVILTTALVFDFAYLLITDPETAINSFQDTFDNGLASATIQDFENTVEEYLGNGFTHLFGTQTLQEMLDDFGLHLSLHIFVVAPLAVVLTLLKGLGILGGLLLTIIAFSGTFGPSNEIVYGVGFLGIAIMGYFIVFDGTLASLIDVMLVNNYIPSLDTGYIFVLDVITRSLSHSFFSLESDYWGIYFLVRLLMRWTSGELTNNDQPQVEASLSDIQTIGDLTSLLTPDNLEKADNTLVEFFTKPMIIGIFLPLVQGLTWAYQVPFFQEMWYHIRGIPL